MATHIIEVSDKSNDTIVNKTFLNELLTSIIIHISSVSLEGHYKHEDRLTRGALRVEPDLKLEKFRKSKLLKSFLECHA